MSQQVSQEYLEGIRDGREWFKKHGMDGAQENLDCITRTARTFAASSPVGQMLRGERDFWRLQIRKAGK